MSTWQQEMRTKVMNILETVETVFKRVAGTGPDVEQEVVEEAVVMDDVLPNIEADLEISAAGTNIDAAPNDGANSSKVAMTLEVKDEGSS
jgi:hypothetical protein